MIAHCRKGEVTEKKGSANAEGHVTCQYRIEGVAGVTARVSPLCSGKYTVKDSQGHFFNRSWRSWLVSKTLTRYTCKYQAVFSFFNPAEHSPSPWWLLWKQNKKYPPNIYLMLWHMGGTKISCTACGKWISKANLFKTKEENTMYF